MVKVFTISFFCLLLGCAAPNGNDAPQADTLTTESDTLILQNTNATALKDTAKPVEQAAPEKPNSKTSPKLVIKEIEEPDLIDTSYIRDPMDHPGYVGTPCEFDETGECIRHNHKKNE